MPLLAQLSSALSIAIKMITFTNGSEELSRKSSLEMGASLSGNGLSRQESNQLIGNLCHRLVGGLHATGSIILLSHLP